MQQEEGPGTLLLPALPLTTRRTLIYPHVLVQELSLPLSLLSPFSALKSFSPQTCLTHLLPTARSIVLHSQEHPLSHSHVRTSSASPAMVPDTNLLGQGPLQPAGALPCAESPFWKANGHAPCACPAGLSSLALGSTETVQRELKGRGMFSQFILQKESLQGVRGRLLAAKVLTNSR